MSRPFLALCLAGALMMPAVAQETVDVAPTPSARFPAAWYPPDNDVTSTMAPVKDAPYLARMVMSGGLRGRPLEQEPLYARDSSGRTRTETVQSRIGTDGKPVDVRQVEVNDAVTHCLFHWTEPWLDTTPPAATVSCMPRRLHYGAQPMWSSVMSMSTQPGEVHPSSMETAHNEPLGVRMFGSVRAIGVRHTRVLHPTDPKDAITIVTEMWVSPEMKEVVAIYPESPDSYSLELRDIQLRAPDAKLFYPPDGYKIQPAPSSP